MRRLTLILSTIIGFSVLLSGCTQTYGDSFSLAGSGETPQEVISMMGNSDVDISATTTSLLSSGDEILVWWPTGAVACSISYLSETNGLTSGHCGSQGSPVYSHGQEIGKISANYLLDGLGLDIAEVEVYPSAEYRVKPSSVSEEELIEGNNIFIEKFGEKKSVGTVERKEFSCQKFSLDNQPVFSYVYLSDLAVSEGDSGAPIFNESGSIVALVQGGNGNDTATIVPISLLDLVKSEDFEYVQEQLEATCK